MEKCIVCGGEIKSKRNKMFCSYKCAGLYKQNYAVCPICGKDFKKSPSDITTHTCGNPDCKKKYRASIMTDNFMQKGHEAIKTSPNTGHFETHHGAVEWKLLSPTGELHEFKNLILWAEQNENLLPISSRTGERVKPKSFVREIARLKSENEKYTYFRDNYYGWRVLKNDESLD